MFTFTDLQELLTFDSAGAKVISLYLNADLGQESSDVIKLKAKNLLKELNGHHVADVAAIDKFLEHEHDWESAGLAIFSCADHDFWRAYPTAVPFRNRIRVKTKPHVKPLAHLLDFYAHYGVVLIDRHGAKFYEYHLGELLSHDGFMGEMVRKLKDGQGSTGYGTRGGGGERQEKEAVVRNMREAAEAAAHFFDGRKIRRLFLGGTDENVSQLRELLPKQLQATVAATFAIDMDASEAEVRHKTMTLLHEANTRRETALVNEMINAAASGGHAMLDLNEILKAVYEGRVQTLIISDGYRLGGYRYDETGFLSSHLVIDQPEAAGEPQKVEDIIEEAVSQTLSYGGYVELVSENPQLESVGHIGAILRY